MHTVYEVYNKTFKNVHVLNYGFMFEDRRHSIKQTINQISFLKRQNVASEPEAHGGGE